MGRGTSKAGGGGYNSIVNQLADSLVKNIKPEQAAKGEIPLSNSDLQAVVEAFAMTHKGVNEDKMLNDIRDLAETKAIQKGIKANNIQTAYNDIMTGKATLSSLKPIAKNATVEKAQFTANGNSVKSQNATIENGNQRIDLRFSTGYNPQQNTKPTKAIETKITATLWKNGNAKGITTISKTASKSNKNAQKQYSEMLEEWKKLTGQSKITF